MERDDSTKAIGAIHLAKARAEVPDRERTRARLEMIFKAAKLEPERVIATKDLEAVDTEGESLIRNVKSLDSIVVKAGRGTLIYSFLDIDMHGRLSFMAFNNGRYEGEHLLWPGESEIIGRGMLTTFRPFRLTLTRIGVPSVKEGDLACVELKASFERPLALY